MSKLIKHFDFNVIVKEKLEIKAASLLFRTMYFHIYSSTFSMSKWPRKVRKIKQPTRYMFKKPQFTPKSGFFPKSVPFHRKNVPLTRHWHWIRHCQWHWHFRRPCLDRTFQFSRRWSSSVVFSV